MNCPVCHNKMESKVTKYFQEWKGHYVVFEKVPAIVCSVCKETLLSGNVVDKINETLWSTPKSSRKEEVDVYELSGTTASA